MATTNLFYTVGLIALAILLFVGFLLWMLKRHDLKLNNLGDVFQDKPDSKFMGYGAKIIHQTLDGQTLMEIECGGKSLSESLKGIERLKEISESVEKKKEELDNSVG